VGHPGLLTDFTDDCVVRFGDLPEFRGKTALERLFRGRSERKWITGRAKSFAP
jgi:hypothetical protein